MLSKNFLFFMLSVFIALSFAQHEATAPRPLTPATTAPRENRTSSTRRTIPPTAHPPITVTPPITNRPTRPTVGPSRPCTPQNNCTRKNPSICGRNLEGMCHRFESICELQLTNCEAGNPLNAWRRVPMMQCRNLRQNAIAKCSIYVPLCPRPLPRCPRPTARGLCVVNRDRRFCRIVANRCTLRNLNCQAQPRESWKVVNNTNCRGMRSGDNPMTCTRRPIRGK